MRNPRNHSDAELLAEESRLIALIDRLEGKRVVKSNRACAQKSLSNVQRELNQREVFVLDESEYLNAAMRERESREAINVY
jgi:hypothetical protein